MKKEKQPMTREDAFIMEVNEELKNERIQQIWNKYGFYIVLFVVVVLTATVSFETIKGWREKKFQTMSDQYAVAVAMQNMGRYDESMAVLNDLEVRAAKEIYDDLAQIQKANILFEQNKNDEAIKVLEDFIAKKPVNSQLHDVAVIKLASYKLENAPAEEIEALLAPLTGERSNWVAAAKEMLAMLAIREKNMDKAVEIYEQLAAEAETPDAIKSRAQDIVLLLNDTKK